MKLKQEDIERVCKAITKAVDLATENSKYKPVGDIIGAFGEELCAKVADMLSSDDESDESRVSKACWDKDPPECPA